MTTTSAPPVAPCSACGTPVFVAVSEAGARLKLEPGRVPHGTVLPVTTRAGELRAHVLTGAELPAEGGAYVDHRRTCGKPTDTRARCRACHGRMDPWLTEQGEIYHVGCKPWTAAEVRVVRDQTPPAAQCAGEGLGAAGGHHGAEAS